MSTLFVAIFGFVGIVDIVVDIVDIVVDTVDIVDIVVDTVDIVDIVDTVDIVDIVDTVDIVDIVDTVDTLDTVHTVDKGIQPRCYWGSVPSGGYFSSPKPDFSVKSPSFHRSGLVVIRPAHNPKPQVRFHLGVGYNLCARVETNPSFFFF